MLTFGSNDVKEQLNKKRIRFSEAVADRICAAIEEGESVVNVAKEEWSPCRATIYKWAEDNSIFSDKFRRAMRVRSKLLIEKLTNEFLTMETEDIDAEGRIVNLTARVTLLDKASAWLRWHAEFVARDTSNSDDIVNINLTGDCADAQVKQLVELVATGKLKISQAEKLSTIIARSIELTELKKLKELLESQIKINEEKNASSNH